MTDGGVPEPPGREEALVKRMRWWRATLRRKKSGVVSSEKVEAATYYEALAECRQRFKDCSLICLTECEPC